MRLVTGDGPLTGPMLKPWRADLALEWEGAPPDTITLGGASVPLGISPLHLPAIDRELVVRRGAEVLRVPVVMAPGARPPADDRELLRAWSKLTQKLRPQTWKELLRVPLLAIESLLERLEPTALDILLQTEGRAAIARIAARPRSYIRAEDERLAVERVSRPARDADRDLSRTGDALLLGRRVVPRQLLSTFIEEEFDIYENRVLVTIISRLRDRAARRLAEANRALERIGVLRGSLDRLYRLHQFRRRGLLEKQAQPRNDHEWLDQVERDKDNFVAQMNGQLATFEAALSRPVGLALRRSPVVRSPLRETNILTFDRDYSLLPRIWRELEREDQPAPDLRFEDAEATYADLLQVGLTRALDELGFEPEPWAGAVPDPSLWCTGGAGCGRARMAGPASSAGRWVVTIARERDHEGWAIDVDVAYRSVPVESAVPATGGRARLGARLAAPPSRPDTPMHRLRLRPTFSPDPSACPTVVRTDGDRVLVWVHPIDQLPEDDQAARSRFNLHTEPAGLSLPMSIAVHPGDWASADRLGRLIRRVTLWTDLEQGRVPLDCPTCGGPSREANRGRSCVDSRCGVRWGQRHCVRCQAQIPKLLPPVPPDNAREDLLLEHVRVGRKRQLFAELGGRDMLADWQLRDGLLPENDLCGDMLACPRCGAG